MEKIGQIEIRVIGKSFKRKKNNDIIRSSAAEYLTFMATTGESAAEVIYADENIWLSQRMMAVLYNIETNTINYGKRNNYQIK